MGTRATLTVSLTPELEEFVSARVGSGRYASASEVVREALRLLEERDLARQAMLDDLRQRIAVGVRQASEGRLVDGDEAFDELESSVAESESTDE
jgi:antitoxin ParD1/3/4